MYLLVLVVVGFLGEGSVELRVPFAVHRDCAAAVSALRHNLIARGGLTVECQEVEPELPTAELPPQKES